MALQEWQETGALDHQQVAVDLGRASAALPRPEMSAMLFWALMASGQITIRCIVAWQTLDRAPAKQPMSKQPIDLAA